MRFFRTTLPDVEDLEWPHYWQVYFKVEWEEGSEEAALCGVIEEYTTIVKLAPTVINNRFFIETYQDDFLSLKYWKKDLPGDAWGRGILSNEMDEGDLIRPVCIDENMNVIPCEWPTPE